MMTIGEEEEVSTEVDMVGGDASNKSHSDI